MAYIYLIRHGQTEWNKQKKYQGNQDSPLTNEGKDQIEQISKEINGINFDITFCSPLGRTKQTLEILNPKSREIVFNDKLKEISLGLLEGKSFTDELPDSLKEEQKKFWDNPSEFNIDGGESFFDVETRVKSFLNQLNLECKNILIVTHTVVIKMFFKIILENEMNDLWNDPFLHPGCLTKLELTKNHSRFIEILYPNKEKISLS